MIAIANRVDAALEWAKAEQDTLYINPADNFSEAKYNKMYTLICLSAASKSITRAELISLLTATTNSHNEFNSQPMYVRVGVCLVLDKLENELRQKKTQSGADVKGGLDQEKTQW